MVMTGPVLSIFTVTELEPESPAKFVALQVITVPAVSPVSVMSLHPVLDATPETRSVTVHFTVTLVLFQPAALGKGVTVGVITGGVLSSFTVTEFEPESPATFVALHVITVPVVSAVSVTSPHPVVDAIP